MYMYIFLCFFISSLVFIKKCKTYTHCASLQNWLFIQGYINIATKTNRTNAIFVIVSYFLLNEEKHGFDIYVAISVHPSNAKINITTITNRILFSFQYNFRAYTYFCFTYVHFNTKYTAALKLCILFITVL